MGSIGTDVAGVGPFYLPIPPPGVGPFWMPITTSISVGLDGTCAFMAEDGNRQVMVGTISLYDREGERQHTIYLAASPEYGKATFYQRLSREIEHVVRLYPRARLTGAG